MGKTSIEWTQHTWNPVRGCSRVSSGCTRCYAEQQAARFCGEGEPFDGFVQITPSGPRWTGHVELIPSMLHIPLKRKKPTTYFVNSMSDLFHEALPDEAIDRVFAVMALCPQHTFQVLTKRAERMREWFKGDGRSRWEDRVYPRAYAMSAIWQNAIPSKWPLPNVWLGVSVEDQPTADQRREYLLQTPAAVRFVSYEPALAAVDFKRYIPTEDGDGHCERCGLEWEDWRETTERHVCPPGFGPTLDWIIIGGESGPGARPFNIAWARQTIAQCRAAGVASFVKQLGALPVIGPDENLFDWPEHVIRDVWHGGDKVKLRDRKGGDMEEWPSDLRVRELPEVRIA